VCPGVPRAHAVTGAAQLTPRRAGGGGAHTPRQLDRQIELGEAVGLIVYYVLYVLIVIVGRQVNQYRTRKRREGMTASQGPGASALGPVDVRVFTCARRTWSSRRGSRPASLLIQDPSDYNVSAIAVEAGLKFRGTAVAAATRARRVWRLSPARPSDPRARASQAPRASTSRRPTPSSGTTPTERRRRTSRRRS